MAKYRERFNDKARAGGVAKRNALKMKRQKQFHRGEAEEEEARKQERLHELARPESDARKRVRMAIQYPEKANAAKRKRLDKYIEKQVRKEEKDELLRKLAQTQKHVDSSSLQSLGALGTGSKAGHTRSYDFESFSGNSDEDSDESLGEASDEETPNRYSGAVPERTQKGSFADLEFEPDSDSNSDSESELEDAAQHRPAILHSSSAEHASEPKSTFIDNRPSGPALGMGGFGFTNLPAKRIIKPKKASWRDRLGIPAAQEMLEDEVADDSDSDVDSESESEEDASNSKADNVSNSDSGEGDEKFGEDSEDTSEDVSEDVSEDAGEGETDESEEDEDADIGDDEKVSTGKEFMDWAKAVDPESSAPRIATPKPQNYTHHHRETEGEAAVKADAVKQPGWVERPELEPVPVQRTPEIEEARTQLPAVASEQQIMDAINHFDVVVITGATGSGKTTQIPQFLFENGYARRGMIGVTQPRRVAAVSMAQRIKSELCGAAQVGYQIRFDSKVGPDTKIKLMTDGVLLKEMSSDLVLTKYSSIVVDEAHERSVNTDILIGLLSRVVKLRREQGNPLKLVVMSATLRVADFAENSRLFSAPPPVVSVEARQFPVTNHFSRRTPTDYVADAITKVQRIHERLPKGGILVFLTGKDEILRAIAELDPSSKEKQSVRPVAGTSAFEEENVDFGGHDDYTEADRGLEDAEAEEEESDLELDPEQDPDMGETHDQKKLHVLPLYSLLSTEDQLRVFEPVPTGHRLCVVATNVAETSLTIPGIRYVVDCGRAKQRIYDLQNGIQKYSVRWISKASADQRSGRAGRTGPGHCYRIFSSAVYERDFPDFADPEIVRMPVEGLVLQMKSMGIHHITNFPFPTAVPQSSLESGIRILQNLGALEITEAQAKTKAHLTPLGQQMSLFPLHPRHAKMLLIGNQHGCLPFVVALVAALSVQDLFVGPSKSAPVLDPQADVLQLLSAVAAYSWTPTNDLCEQFGLRPKAMSEVASLRQQLAKLVAQTLRGDAVATLTEELSKPLPVPTAHQLSALKQIVAAGYIDMIVARKALFDTDVRASKQVSRQPYVTVQREMPSSTVFLHPHTVLQLAPDFVVYSSMTANDETDKIRVRPLTAVTETQLSALAAKTPLITYSKPLGGAYAPKMIDASTREVWVVPRYGASLGSGGLGWDLPAKKVVQIRKGSQWVAK